MEMSYIILTIIIVLSIPDLGIINLILNFVFLFRNNSLLEKKLECNDIIPLGNHSVLREF